MNRTRGSMPARWGVEIERLGLEREVQRLRAELEAVERADSLAAAREIANRAVAAKPEIVGHRALPPLVLRLLEVG